MVILAVTVKLYVLRKDSSIKDVDDMEIREIKGEEIETARELIWETFKECESHSYPEEGIDTFHEFITSEEEMEKLEFFGAFEDDELLGVLATRGDREHIASFFVEVEHQGRGIGRQLFEYLLENSSSPYITVNSSVNAEPVYRKFGFTNTGSRQMSDGITFIPMEYRHV